VRLLTKSMPTTNERFRETFDWEPKYPSYRDGLDEVVETWRSDGLLVADGDGYEWRET
jgi:nucleoside-diphosphate-sugar epimerase